MLTPDQVATRLSVHVETVRRMIRDNRLPATKLGNGRRARLRIDELELQKFIDAQSTN
jgi:excisionase family DNA binding protein